MANQLIGSSAAAIHMYQALYGQAPSIALYTSYTTSIDSTSPAAFAATMAGNYSNVSDSALALQVLNNLGVTATTVTAAGEYTTLLAAVEQAFAAYPTMRGQVILNMTNLLGNLETDATYGAAAKTYNAQATADFTYANNTANTVSGVVTLPDPTIGQPFTLTTGIDSGALFTGTTGADTFNATHLTFNATDVLVGNGGADTLRIVDTGTSAFLAPAASVSGIQTIKLANLNVGSAGVTEVATVAFQALGANETVIIAGRTITAPVGGATAADVATVFVSNVTTNGVTSDSGALVGYTVAAGGTVNSVVFTSTAAVPSNVTDLSVTGSAMTGIAGALKTFTIPIATGAVTATDTLTFTYNGVTLNAGVIGVGAAGVGAAIAAAINAYVGAGTAAAAGSGLVTVSIPFGTNVAIGTMVFAGGGAEAVAAPTAVSAGSAAIAAAAPTVSIVQGALASGTTDTLAAGNFTGATSFVSDLSTGGLTITGLTAAQSVALNASSGNLSATWGGTVTAATVNLTNGTSGGVVTTAGGAGLVTETVNSTGANTLSAAGTAGLALAASVATLNINADTSLNTNGVTGAGLTKIVVAGAATSVNLFGSTTANVALPALVTTVDASGLTAGGVTAQLVAGITSFKGGAGSDTVKTTGAGTLTSATASIDGGTGTGTDTLILAAVGDVASIAEGAKYTNFETLQIGAFIADASLVAGITAIKLGGAGSSALNMNATQAAAITVTATDATGQLSLKDPSGLADIVNLTASATGVVNVTGLQITGVETLNFKNSSGAADTLSFSGAGTGLKTITVAGAKGVTLDVATAHATTLTAIDASGLTAQATGTNTFTLNDTVGGHALKNGLTITGSGGDDIFNLPATDTLASGVVVTINAGAGNDAVTATLGQLYTGGAGYMVLDGGANGTAGDTLTVSNAAAGTVADGTFAHVTNFENLAFSNTGTLTLTSGGFFNSAFPTGVTITDGATGANAVTIDLSLYSGAAKITNVGTTGLQTISGSAQADTITVTTQGTTAATGVVVVGGAGADKITVNEVTATTTTAGGVINVTGGTGADVITLSTAVLTAGAFSDVILNVGVGDSNVGAADTVSGFYVAGVTRLVDTIEFAGAAIKPLAGFAATAVTGHTLADLSVAVSTAGLITFAGTSAATVTAANVESIWTSQIAPLLNSLETAVWADANTADTAQFGNSLVFNHNTLGDSEVILVGVAGATAVGAPAATANLVGIA